MEREKVLKALECCGTESLAQKKCRQCPYSKSKGGTACMADMCKDARDLIRRQQPEQAKGANYDDSKGGGTEYDVAAAVVRAVDYLSGNLPTIIDKFIEHFPQAIAKAAMMIENRQEQGEAESLNREVYNRLQDIIKLYPYPLGGKNFEEWDGSGD